MVAGWVAISLSFDVPDCVAIPVRLEGVDLALWRSASGKLHLWGDRCPHRGMRLSHGFVRGERLSCIYHGWQYGDGGVCTQIPAHPALTPPSTICAATYSVTEADGVVWGALEEPNGPPPSISEYAPLRSLQIEIPIERLSNKVAGASSSNANALAHDDLMLLPQPVDVCRTMVHALSPVAVNKRSASQELETLRRKLEEAI